MSLERRPKEQQPSNEPKKAHTKEQIQEILHKMYQEWEKAAELSKKMLIEMVKLTPVLIKYELMVFAPILLTIVIAYNLAISAEVDPATLNYTAWTELPLFYETVDGNDVLIPSEFLVISLLDNNHGGVFEFNMPLNEDLYYYSLGGFVLTQPKNPEIETQVPTTINVIDLETLSLREITTVGSNLMDVNATKLYPFGQFMLVNPQEQYTFIVNAPELQPRIYWLKKNMEVVQVDMPEGVFRLTVYTLGADYLLGTNTAGDMRLFSFNEEAGEFEPVTPWIADVDRTNIVYSSDYSGFYFVKNSDRTVLWYFDITTQEFSQIQLDAEVIYSLENEQGQEEFFSRNGTVLFTEGE